MTEVKKQLSMSKKKMNYDTALDKLRAILDKLQSDELSIDELGKSVKEAEELIKTCKDKLRGIEGTMQWVSELDMEAMQPL